MILGTIFLGDAHAQTAVSASNESNEFDKRVKIAELMLKEADIKNKSKIVELQMADKRGKVENDFLDRLSKELS